MDSTLPGIGVAENIEASVIESVLTHRYSCSHITSGSVTRYGRFAHTLLTPFGSVGVSGWKSQAWVYLESTTYEWFGLVRTARNGFDSRKRAPRLAPLLLPTLGAAGWRLERRRSV